MKVALKIHTPLPSPPPLIYFMLWSKESIQVGYGKGGIRVVSRMVLLGILLLLERRTRQMEEYLK